MSNKKTKKEAKPEVKEIPAEVSESIKSKWIQKKQFEAQAGNILQQIMGVSDYFKLTPDQVNDIIGEKVFQKG